MCRLSPILSIFAMRQAAALRCAPAALPLACVCDEVFGV